MANQAEAAVSPEGVPLDQQPKKKAGKKKLVFLLLLALLIIGGGGAGVMVAMQPATEADADLEGAAADAAQAQRAKTPVFLALEPFVVNLRGDEGNDNYLRVGVVLEGTDEAAIGVAKAQLQRIRNGIILLLSSKTTDDISTMEGKHQLMQEIIVASRIPMTLPEPSKGIESVYLSDFVIQ